MNKKEELKAIIDSLNTLMGKIDSVDEPKPTTDFTTGNNAFKHLQQPKYPEGILSVKEVLFNTIYTYDNHMNYQDWCSTYLAERTNFKNSIHSVKNSKGEVFTVDDSIKIYSSNGYIGTIKSFRIVPVYGEEKKSVLYANCEVIGDHHIDYLTKVDKPHPLKTYPEGIIEFRKPDGTQSTFTAGKGNAYQEWVGQKLYSGFEIFTVKNKAGVEFSVGDYAHYENGSEVKINSFFISNGLDSSLHEIIIAMHSNGSCGIDLLTKAKPKEESLLTEDENKKTDSINKKYKPSEWVKKIANLEPKKEPLFKTEDGFDVFEGDGYFAVRNSDFHICEYAALFAKYLVDEGYYTRFKHKSNAEKYVAENKKSISYKELEDYVVLTTPFLKLPEQVALRNILNHFKPVKNHDKATNHFSYFKAG